METPATLVDEAAPADADWIRSAFQDHQGALVSYVHQLLDDLDQAQDVVQDAFLRLCAEEAASVRDHVRPWLFTVCRHRALDRLRRTRRLTPLHETDAGDREDPDPTPAAVAATNEQVGRALQFLRRLPENQREVLVLKFQHALAYQEISAITGLSVGNVGFLIHTGLKTLRRWLEAGPTPARPAERRSP
jgi:RNA polymerase sigma-70 factor (ECF subfamily)